MRVLTWNLFHGRAVPPAGQALADQFAAALAEWEWDLALLQETPPWWPKQLARRSGAQWRMALTSRNSALRLRRFVAERWPDLIKSNGGGSNAILARLPITEHRLLRLRSWPERRVAQLARLQGGCCVANYHGSARAALAQQEFERLCELALGWAGDAPLVIGGDLNLRSPVAPHSDIARAASRDVDHLFTHRLRPLGGTQILDRQVLVRGHEALLSDHPPLLAILG